MSKSKPRDASKRVLDEATRMRRARKALEALESDNFHDDPHAGLTMSKKALSLFQVLFSDNNHCARPLNAFICLGGDE